MSVFEKATSTLVARIERAIKDDRVTSLAVALSALQNSGLLDDPSLFASANEERYARKLIYHDPKDRFIVVGMTWAPGQGAPLHDHGHLWGGEIVVRGTMAEQTFELLERREELYRFRGNGERIARPGTVGILSPPLEYHSFKNAGDSVAHTLHVYSGDITAANAFVRVDRTWHRASPVYLRYNA
jgi:3-mercaptopropionate dioxygenase